MPSTAPPAAVLDRRRLLRHAGTAALVLGGLRAWSEDAAAPPAARAELAFGACAGVDAAAVLKQAQADYIEDKVGSLLVPDQGAAAFAIHAAAAAAAVPPVRCCNFFIPGDLKSVGPAPAHAAILAYAATAFQRARACGITTITFGSGGSRMVPAGFAKAQAEQQFTDLLARLGPLAAAQQVVVAVEPLNTAECNFLNSIGEVAAVVAKAGHPAVGITADLYHMVLAGDVPADLEKHLALVRHFHLAEKAKRAMPGVAGDDFRRWFSVLAKHGWKGRASIENGGGVGTAAQYAKSFAFLRAEAKAAGL